MAGAASRNTFLPTPSARRATDACEPRGDGSPISTHALREEGDLSVPGASACVSLQFLPTPSARRATPARQAAEGFHHDFYPRPPRGGRRIEPDVYRRVGLISTHALREEGDLEAGLEITLKAISTHALREEGDMVRPPGLEPGREIS